MAESASLNAYGDLLFPAVSNNVDGLRVKFCPFRLTDEWSGLTVKSVAVACMPENSKDAVSRSGFIMDNDGL